MLICFTSPLTGGVQVDSGRGGRRGRFVGRGMRADRDFSQVVQLERAGVVVFSTQRNGPISVHEMRIV
jgi:hypothetical protein